MNLMYGNVLQVFEENGQRKGKIRISGALVNVCLTLLPEVEAGDQVLLCEGVPIRKIIKEQPVH